MARTAWHAAPLVKFDALSQVCPHSVFASTWQLHGIDQFALLGIRGQHQSARLGCPARALKRQQSGKSFRMGFMDDPAGKSGASFQPLHTTRCSDLSSRFSCGRRRLMRTAPRPRRGSSWLLTKPKAAWRLEGRVRRLNRLSFPASQSPFHPHRPVSSTSAEMRM